MPRAVCVCVYLSWCILSDRIAGGHVIKYVSTHTCVAYVCVCVLVCVLVLPTAKHTITPDI